MLTVLYCTSLPRRDSDSRPETQAKRRNKLNSLDYGVITPSIQVKGEKARKEK